MTTKTFTIIPRFILAALHDVADEKLVPSVREGEGGNSHSVWFIKFTISERRADAFDKLHDFVVKVTSSYSQQFLEFTPYSGAGFDGTVSLASMRQCIEAARAAVVRETQNGRKA